MDLDEQGLATRRAVLGSSYVDSALAKGHAVHPRPCRNW